MALPLSTPGSCCGHTLNLHDRVRVNGVAVRPCLACSCRDFVADQCRAELHGQADDNIRCQAELGAQGTHDGDHWVAVDEFGNKVHWTESVAVYPDPSGDDARETQIGGRHYAQHKIQVWDVAIEYNLSYIEGSALKYLLRRKDNRLEDLEKARHCLDRLIELERGE